MGVIGTSQQQSFYEWSRSQGENFEASPPAFARPTSLWRERRRGESLLVPGSLAPLIRSVREAIVNVFTYEGGEHSDVPAGPLPANSASGFFLNPEGYVLTSYRVVKGAHWIHILVSERPVLEAELIGFDASTDIALLRVTDESPRPFSFLYIGDSDRLQVGDWLVAMGNPLGLGLSVSHGILAAKERQVGFGPFDDFLQTDATINPGAEGGPLVNMRGEVVGLVVPTSRRGQGIGFAVPINFAKDILPRLLDGDYVQHGWLGLVVSEDRQSSQSGSAALVVSKVVPGSPAARAGILPGDIIRTMNGQAFESYPHLHRHIELLAPGTVVRLSVFRAGTVRAFDARVTEMPP